LGGILALAFEEVCDENLPECDLSHNGMDKINGKIVGNDGIPE
jgi:hypothetical protein